MPLLDLDQFARVDWEAVRGWAYRVASRCIAPMLVFYGVLSAEEVALWVGFVAVLFEVPAHFTPVRKPYRLD